MDNSDWARITLLLETSDHEIKRLDSHSIPPKMVKTMEAKFRGDFDETVKFMENLREKSKGP